jgi:hypothetical protein
MPEGSGWGNLLAVGGAFLGGGAVQFTRNEPMREAGPSLSRGVPPHDVQDARRGRRP